MRVRGDCSRVPRVEKHQEKNETTGGRPLLNKTLISVITKTRIIIIIIIRHYVGTRTCNGSETRANSKVVIGKMGREG